MRGTRAAVAAALVVLAVPSAAFAADTAPAPIDPQQWSWQDDMTWNDYKPLPGPDYSDPCDPAVGQEVEGGAGRHRLPGQEFASPSRPAHDLRHARRREAQQTSRAHQVPAFYRDFLNTPSPAQPLPDDEPVLDGGHVRQVRRGARRLRPLPDAVPLVPVLQSSTARAAQCPTPARRPCNKNFRTDARAAWVAAVGLDVVDSFDNIFYVAAGQDQSAPGRSSAR